MTQDNIKKCLREQGIATEIKTNGYWYRFNHKDLHVEFCAQSNYHGSGRFVGEMYKENLSSEEVEAMKQAFVEESLVRIPNPEEWAQGVRTYDHRRIHIGGYLDNLIPELMQLMNTTSEDYISQRLQYSAEFEKALQQALSKESPAP